MSRGNDREDQHLKDALKDVGRAWGTDEGLPDEEILHVRPPKPKLKEKKIKREE